LFFCVFGGQTFIPEGVEGPNNTDPALGLTREQVLAHPVPKYAEWDGKYVMTGMLQGFDGTLMYEPYNDTTPSRHLTFVFNVFVLFQIFNMLAARKIKDEINIFSGLFTNLMFILVWIVIVVGQYFIVQYGSLAMKVHIAGLT
jgi:magnesium-transporting ATPase (P-type)